MLVFVTEFVDEQNKADFGIVLKSILLSVALADAHILLEFVQLSYEAKACKTSMSNYSIACFNGKFGWVPYADDLAIIAEQIDNDSIEEWKSSLELDFDDIRYSNLFVDCKVPFSFSDAGVSTLCLRVDDLPAGMEHEFVIKVGLSIEDLQIEDLQKLIVICGPKTDLRIETNEKQFMDKIMLSKVYRENFDLRYT